MDNPEHQPLHNVYGYLQGNSFEVNKAISRKSAQNYAVMLVNLYGDRNIGTMIRTSTIMGASKVIMVGRRIFDRRTSVGAQHYIEVVRYLGFPDDLQVILGDYSPICIEQGGESLDDLNWVPYVRGDLKPPCFIFGAEDTGLSREFIEKCRKLDSYRCVSIPQTGILRSMNVSTVHSIVLNDYAKEIRKQTKDRYSLI